APRPFHLHAEEERRHHQDEGADQHGQRQPPHPAHAEKGNADQDKRRQHHEDDLARDEVKAFQPDALGDRRARREGQDHAQSHPVQQGFEQPAGDRPPPGADETAVGAAYHGVSPSIISTPSRALTASRNAAPRASKFLYWSKLAQAGDRRTTGSGAGSSAASRAACSTATGIVSEIS